MSEGENPPNVEAPLPIDQAVEKEKARLFTAMLSTIQHGVCEHPRSIFVAPLPRSSLSEKRQLDSEDMQGGFPTYRFSVPKATNMRGVLADFSLPITDPEVSNAAHSRRHYELRIIGDEWRIERHKALVISMVGGVRELVVYSGNDERAKNRDPGATTLDEMQDLTREVQAFFMTV